MSNQNVRASVFFQRLSEGDFIRVENEEGHSWTGDVKEIDKGGNGEAARFGEHSLVRYDSEPDVLQLGPEAGPAMRAGLHVPVSLVVNESSGVVWDNPER